MMLKRSEIVCLVISLFICSFALVKCGYPYYEEDDLYENVAPPNGRCVWYDNCLDISLGRHAPCAVNITAVKVDDHKTYDLLQEWCPMYVNGTDNTYTCCNYAQLADLDKEFTMMEQMLGRCPSCLRNLLKLYCALSCDPNQSNFMYVTQTFP